MHTVSGQPPLTYVHPYICMYVTVHTTPYFPYAGRVAVYWLSIIQASGCISHAYTKIYTRPTYTLHRFTHKAAHLDRAQTPNRRNINTSHTVNIIYAYIYTYVHITSRYICIYTYVCTYVHVVIGEHFIIHYDVFVLKYFNKSCPNIKP